MTGFEALLTFEGEPAAFWQSFLAYAAGESGADAALLAVGGEEGTWKQVQAWTDLAETARNLSSLQQAVARMGPGLVESGEAVHNLEGGGQVFAIRLPAAGERVAGLFLSCATTLAQQEIPVLLKRLHHLGGAIVAYEARRRLGELSEERERFGVVLDLMLRLRGENKFQAAALRFCNEVSGTYNCDRVSLGWQKGEYLRLTAFSHAERFEKKMEAIRQLETAMEEALDQDEEIVLPAGGDADYVFREHEALARAQGAAALVSLPLRHEDEPVAVLCCERTRSFTSHELGHMRLLCDQMSPLLYDLHQRDRWVGARLVTWLSEAAQRMGTPRQTLPKILGFSVALVLLILAVLPIPFKVRSSFELRADQAVYLPAPFEGFLAEVLVVPGEAVEKGQVLLRLDTRDLHLEEVAALADLERFQRERDRAHADNELATFRITAAQVDQAEARLQLIRHRLSQSELKAPFDGVLIEGDLRERIGSPMRLGDPLMRIARLDRLYVQLDFDQRDAPEVQDAAEVRLAVSGRPGERVPARLTAVEPRALAKDGRTVFPARAEVEGDPPDWLRPGMTGVCRIEAGRHSPLWILGRRTVDFLRVQLWW